MADEFPEDSFFRNSNIAALDAAIEEKKDASTIQRNGEIKDNVSVPNDSSAIFISAKQLLISRGAGALAALKTSNQTTVIAKGPTESSVSSSKNPTKVTRSRGVSDKSTNNPHTSKKARKFDNRDAECEEETGATGNSSQKTETCSKSKHKQVYQPLNITKNIVLQNKHPNHSASDVMSNSSSACLPASDGPCKEAHSDTSSLLSTQQKLKLDAWGLPQSILKQYARRGITEMFPWQVECLCCPRVLNGGNLVYSAPTSAGKTLVSEIVCIKTVLERRKKVLFVLPFVSVVREKMFYFQEIFQGSKVRVDGYMGGHSAAGGFQSLDLAVCTIEKANSLVNRMMEENELMNLGAVIVDELHLLGDPHRGYLLELLLTKLKYMSLKSDNISVQIVGMSATLPNLSLLSNWLDADLYKTTYRPVPLEELIKIGNILYNNSLKPVRTLCPEITIKNDTEDIVYLCLETIANGHSVLIFCPTKAWCESLAQTVASEFRTIGLGRDVNAPDSLAFKLREQLNSDRIGECLEQLRSCPVGLDKLLGKVVSFGVAYHHAGLSMDERDIIEGCFKNSSLRVLIATTTLSSGVNLPARRVIVRSPVFQGRPIDILSYRQMIGRAGRMGVDSAGESIVICQKTEQRIVSHLVCSQLKPIESCLGLGDLSASLKRAILEVIASGVASTPEDLQLYTSCTLLARSHEGKEDTSDPVSSCITFLLNSELIRLQTGEDGVLRYSPTPLGQACLSASIHPDEGLRLFQELQRARQCFVLENELHLVYEVTPFNVADQWNNLDWMHVLSLWEQLAPDMKRVGELVGVEDRFIVRAMRGTVNLKLEKQRQKLMVHKRFYTALALHDLVNEVPLNVVATKFNCSRGMLQSLQQSAATYAGMVTSFCHRLGWSSVQLIIDQFQDRLHFGTHRELLDLLRLPSINGPRARALYNAGITCVTELTTADVLVVENALHAAIPFLSDKGRDGETTSEAENRRRLKGIWITGRQGVSEREAAELLIKEARTFIQVELGLVEVNWDQPKQKPSLRIEEDLLLGDKLGINRNDSSYCVASGSQIMHEQSENSGKNSVKLVGLITPNQIISTEEEKTDAVSEEKQSDFEISQASKSINSSAEVLFDVSSQNKIVEVDDFDTTNVLSIRNTQENLRDESLPIALSPINVSGLLDNNICDVSNNSEALEIISPFLPSKTVTPKISSHSPCKTTKKFPNSFDNLFESSFLNSALAKLDDGADELVQGIKEQHKPNKDSVPIAATLQNTDSCLESWGISITALNRLCLQEECGHNIAPQEQENLQHPESISSERRLSSDFMRSSSESRIPTANNKESEDLFSSFTTPVSDRVLRPRNKNGSGSHSKSKQEALSPQLFTDDSKSPSLFGDSFEINTGLMEVLDGNRDMKTPCLEKRGEVNAVLTSNTNNAVTLNDGPSQIVEVNSCNDFSATISSVHKRRSEMRRKFLGSSKDPPYSLRVKEIETAEDEAKSLCQLKTTSRTQRGTNLHLGLSRRGPNKKNDSKDSPKPKRTAPIEHKSEVLTDSFLEAAFQTAFYTESLMSSDSSLTHNKGACQNGQEKFSEDQEQEDGMLVCNKKKLKMSESEEELFNSPEGPVTNASLSEPLQTHISCTISSKAMGEEQANNKQEESTPVHRVIGPPLTRKMLATQQRTEAVTSQPEDAKKDSSYPNTMFKEDQPRKNPFSFSVIDDWNTYNVIDVCRNNILFKTFAKEVFNSMLWAVSFACEQTDTSKLSMGIGCKVVKTQKLPTQNLKSERNLQLAAGNSVLVGVSFCFGGADAYFLSLEEKSEQCTVRLKDRLALLRKVLCRIDIQPNPIICCFDLKEQFKMLFRCTGIQMYQLSTCDPKVGDWLLEPEGKEKTFHAMVLKYAEKASGLAEHAGHVKLGQGSPALDINQSIPGRQRSSVEAILCYQIMCAQYTKLQEAGLLSCFFDVEMPVVVCLSRLELIGIGFDTDAVQSLQEKLRKEMLSLEKKAYQLAGRMFLLTSPADTARVIYQELRLGQSLKGHQRNTSKETLGKLRSEHSLPAIILMWRKLNAIHSKTVCPLLPSEACTRLYGQCILHTATGRISMHEPNIQCIPRDFNISLESKESFCMRAAFVASAGNMLVAADYSQLELRLLAHLSGEPKLQSILNCDQDVFCNLAATWNHITIDQVSDDLRQKAKQLCYGIIYGMGVKAMAGQLEVDELEAASLLETFHRAFPGINDYLSKTIDQCRKEGYVKTLLGRRRYLPGILSSNIHVKAHAERQAVNTTVQGSAADLTKTAMIAVEESIFKAFPQSIQASGKDLGLEIPRLVLHLHDELMYEVPQDFVDHFCLILKHGMERAIPLLIDLPVKVKVGKSWGNLRLKEFED